MVARLVLLCLFVTFCVSFERASAEAGNEKRAETKRLTAPGFLGVWSRREKRDAEEDVEPKSKVTRVKEWITKTVHRLLGADETGSDETRGSDSDEEGDQPGLVSRFVRWLMNLFINRFHGRGSGQRTEDFNYDNVKEIETWRVLKGARNATNVEEVEAATSDEVADWENSN